MPNEIAKRTLVNPFFNRTPHIKQPALDNKMLARVVSMEVDPDTLTSKPVFEFVDTEAEIQASKDLCGLDYMKKLLRSGQVTPDELADNGKSNFDATVLPETVHDANGKAQEVNQQIGDLAKAIGAEEGKTYTAREIESMLSAAVAKQYEASKAKADPAPAQESK